MAMAGEASLPPSAGKGGRRFGDNPGRMLRNERPEIARSEPNGRRMGMEARMTPEVEARALGESLKTGATLPASWYTSESVFPQEMRAIFGRYWQYACRIDEVAQPGGLPRLPRGNVPVVVVRNRSNQITAFINVCRHRGAEIVLDGSRGNRNTLQCHYHAWTWDLDGRLRSGARLGRRAVLQERRFSSGSCGSRRAGAVRLREARPAGPELGRDGRRASPDPRRHRPHR